MANKEVTQKITDLKDLGYTVLTPAAKKALFGKVSKIDSKIVTAQETLLLGTDQKKLDKAQKLADEARVLVTGALEALG